jgi:hypothetical protein
MLQYGGGTSFPQFLLTEYNFIKRIGKRAALSNGKVYCVFLQNEKFEAINMVILLFSAITNGALLPSTSFILEEIHLVRCLKYISHRHFVPGRSIVISSPAADRFVQKELIAEIQRTSIWPVVVTVDGNISIPENQTL